MAGTAGSADVGLFLWQATSESMDKGEIYNESQIKQIVYLLWKGELKPYYH